MFGMVGNPTFYARLASPNKALGRVLAWARFHVLGGARPPDPHSMSLTPQTAALSIDGSTLDLAGLEAVARDGRAVVIGDDARAAVRASRQVVDAAVARGDVVYGVTTGFGSFAD